MPTPDASVIAAPVTSKNAANLPAPDSAGQRHDTVTLMLLGGATLPLVAGSAALASLRFVPTPGVLLAPVVALAAVAPVTFAGMFSWAASTRSATSMTPCGRCGWAWRSAALWCAPWHYVRGSALRATSPGSAGPAGSSLLGMRPCWIPQSTAEDRLVTPVLR